MIRLVGWAVRRRMSVDTNENTCYSQILPTYLFFSIIKKVEKVKNTGQF